MSEKVYKMQKSINLKSVQVLEFVKFQKF